MVNGFIIVLFSSTTARFINFGFIKTIFHFLIHPKRLYNYQLILQIISKRKFDVVLNLT